MANIASAEKIAKRKKEILDASIEVFASKGYHAAGIADIATALNIGHGTVYRYYKNKRDIFDAILSELLAKMAAIVQQEPPNTNSLNEYKDQLERIADTLLDIFYNDPRLAKIAFYESMGIDPEISQSVERILDLFAQFTEAYMKNGVEKGFLREEMDQEIAARLITAMLVETVKQVAIGQYEDKDVQRWRSEILRFMVGGLGR